MKSRASLTSATWSGLVKLSATCSSVAICVENHHAVLNKLIELKYSRSWWCRPWETELWQRQSHHPNTAYRAWYTTFPIPHPMLNTCLLGLAVVLVPARATDWRPDVLEAVIYCWRQMLSMVDASGAKQQQTKGDFGYEDFVMCATAPASQPECRNS